MNVKRRLEHEWKLRAMLTDLFIRRGYECEVFFLDLFSFLDDYRELSALEVRNVWKSYIKSCEADAQMSLYLHVPFCRCRCDFCRYHQWLYVDQKQMDCYVESMCQEMEFFHENFQGIEFQTLYVGGGTPNLLNTVQLKKLFKTLNGHFQIRPQGERTFECNPLDTTYEKLAVLSENGINSVSFGVQSSDAGMLNAMNRGYQNFSMVRQAIAHAQKFKNFKRINADLMIGLFHDTAKGVFESFCRVADLGVDTISVYPLTPQLNYLKTYYQSDQRTFERNLKEKMSAFEALVVPEAERRGYFHTPMAEAFRSDTWGFASQKCYASGWTDISLYSSSVNAANYLGIGAGAASNIMKNILYKNEGLEKTAREGAYFSTGTRYRGRLRHNAVDEKLWFIFQDFARFGELSRVEYENLFGSDVVNDYASVFEKLEDLGAVQMTEKSVDLLAKNPREKFIYSLFFVEEQIIFKLADKYALCPGGHSLKQSSRGTVF